jgi:hypothetical protein
LSSQNQEHPSEATNVSSTLLNKNQKSNITLKDFRTHLQEKQTT